jgi:hypothetical protein
MRTPRHRITVTLDPDTHALVTELAARERRTPANMAVVLMLYTIHPVRWGRLIGPKARDLLRVVRRRAAA